MTDTDQIYANLRSDLISRGVQQGWSIAIFSRFDPKTFQIREAAWRCMHVADDLTAEALTQVGTLLALIAGKDPDCKFLACVKRLTGWERIMEPREPHPVVPRTKREREEFARRITARVHEQMWRIIYPLSVEELMEEMERKDIERRIDSAGNCPKPDQI